MHLRPTLLLVMLATSAMCVDQPLQPTDPRADNPRFQAAPADVTEDYPAFAATASRPADPAGDAVLERRNRVQVRLEAISAGGLGALSTDEQAELMALFGADLLLLPEDGGRPFRQLTVIVLDRILVDGWWGRPADRRIVAGLFDVVAQAHIAGGRSFLDEFDAVGTFDGPANRVLGQIQEVVPTAATFAEVDAAESVARHAYAILAAVGRAPASTFHELAVYAALVRRRQALSP